MVLSKAVSEASIHSTFASRYVRTALPRFRMAENSIPKEAAYQIINDELMLDGNPRLNLASFVTTWMEPECDKLVMAAINKNYVDMDEYPVTTELQNRCVNMIAHLFNAPLGESETAVGVGTVGSSEAIMLAGLAFKRRWQNRRKAEGKPCDKPNIVTGANVQVCWEKFARYFEVELKEVKLSDGYYVMDPEKAVEMVDENTICVAAILGSTLNGEFEDVKRLNDLLVEKNKVQVEPNQEFQGLVCEGANVLPAKFLEDKFRDGYGKIVNIRHLDEVIKSINGWYTERGLFGLVSDIEILSGGILRLQVAEAEVNNITVRFLDRKTGEPTTGKTRPETILRQLTTKKGQVYSLLQGKRDVETILTMGIMEDVTIIPQPAGDTRKVDLVMNLVERPSGGFSAGGGISSGITNGPLSGLIGSFAYSHRNVFGRNQKLNLSLERGQIDSIFRINYTDPWIEGDDKRTSRSIMIQNSRMPGTLVHGYQQGGVTIGRVTAGIEFSRPFRPKWSGTAGLIFHHAGARDDKGTPIIRDFYNSPLTASGNTHDDMLIAKLEGVYTGSGDHGSPMLVVNMEQGLPILPEWLCFNRVTARARQGVEVGPVRLLTSLCGGHVVGNFSPHEAFTIGGTNSVRGYEEGAVGSGRSYAVGSGEMSFPVYGPVGGVLFADYGSDLGSGPTVPGDPAGARGKPGSGYGYGIGVRVDSPLGPLRLEYAFNDRHARRFHFGVGHRN